MAQITAAGPTAISSGATSLAVGIPANVSAGDMLILSGMHRSSTISPPAGWDLVVSEQVSGYVQSTFVMSRIADGTEGTTVTVQQPTNARFIAFVLVISGATNVSFSSRVVTTDDYTPSTVFPEGTDSGALLLSCSSSVYAPGTWSSVGTKLTFIANVDDERFTTYAHGQQAVSAGEAVTIPAVSYVVSPQQGSTIGLVLFEDESALVWGQLWPRGNW